LPIHPLQRVALAVLILPLAEIAAFIVAAIVLGPLRAILLLVALSVAGAVILRRTGRGVRLRGTTQGIAWSAGAADASPFTALAGILLVIPGFITGVLGLVLLLPPARRALGTWIAAWFAGAMARPPEGVVDLDPEEWRRQDNPEAARQDPRLPRRRPDGEPP